MLEEPKTTEVEKRQIERIMMKREKNETKYHENIKKSEPVPNALLLKSISEKIKSVTSQEMNRSYYDKMDGDQYMATPNKTYGKKDDDNVILMVNSMDNTNVGNLNKGYTSNAQ